MKAYVVETITVLHCFCTVEQAQNRFKYFNTMFAASLGPKYHGYMDLMDFVHTGKMLKVYPLR